MQMIARMNARRRPRRAGRSGGFLLIEVMIAMLLLMICGAGSLALLSGVFFSTGYSGQVQTASRLGQEVLDRAMLEPFATVGSPPNSACVTSAVYATGATTPSGPGDNVQYTRSCAVTSPVGTL